MVATSFHKDKKSKEDKAHLEDAVSGDEDNSPTEHVDDANAMGECDLVWVIFTLIAICSICSI